MLLIFLLSFLTTGVSHLTFVFFNAGSNIKNFPIIQRVWLWFKSWDLRDIHCTDHKGKWGKVHGLIRGAGTRFTTWFYAIHCALRLEGSLLATFHYPHFAKLYIVKTNNRVMLAVHDVKSKSFWRAVYILLRCVFPALRLLCYSDSNIPAMDKLYYLSHRVTVALETFTEDLNDNDLFLALEDDGGVAF